MEVANRPKQTPQILRAILRWALPFAPALAALGLLELCKHSAWYAEQIHARIFYPIFASVLSFFTSAASFSWTELLTLLALPLVVLIVWRIVRGLKRSDRPGLLAARLLRGLLWILSSVFLLYMLMHGLNFYRSSLAQLYELDTSPKDAAFLQQVVMDLADKASEAREQVSEDENGIMRLFGGKEDCLRSANAALASARELNPLLRGNGAKPKWVLVSEPWSYTGITGFYMMPLCEANVNVAQPDFCIPFTAAHELSHTCAIAREDEANFAAFLLCRDASDPEYRYSGYAMAYIYCANALYDYDLDLWSEAREHLSEAVRRDFVDQSAFWAAHQGPVQEVSTQVNDTFLKSQGQDDGVLSYDRVVSLILALYEKESH